MKPTSLNNQPAPQVGNIVIVRGVRCRIFKLHPFGTMDVEQIDGPNAWRISGAPFILETK